MAYNRNEKAFYDRQRRDLRILDRRTDGLSFSELAEEFGVSRTTVRKVVHWGYKGILRRESLWRARTQEERRLIRESWSDPGVQRKPATV